MRAGMAHSWVPCQPPPGATATSAAPRTTTPPKTGGPSTPCCARGGRSSPCPTTRSVAAPHTTTRMITLRNVLGGVPLVVERASATALKDAVTWSGWFHRREPRALVLVWPTTGGIFAWQPGAPEALNEAQPPSWREAIVHTGGVAAVPIWAFPVPEDHVCLTCRHVLEEEVPILWVARDPTPRVARTGACTVAQPATMTLMCAPSTSRTWCDRRRASPLPPTSPSTTRPGATTWTPTGRPGRFSDRPAAPRCQSGRGGEEGGEGRGIHRLVGDPRELSLIHI